MRLSDGRMTDLSTGDYNMPKKISLTIYLPILIVFCWPRTTPTIISYITDYTAHGGSTPYNLAEDLAAQTAQVERAQLTRQRRQRDQKPSRWRWLRFGRTARR